MVYKSADHDHNNNNNNNKKNKSPLRGHVVTDISRELC